MGAAVSPLSVLAITAAWLVCALVRGAVGLATGSLMGDVMEPAVRA